MKRICKFLLLVPFFFLPTGLAAEQEPVILPDAIEKTFSVLADPNSEFDERTVCGTFAKFVPAPVISAMEAMVTAVDRVRNKDRKVVVARLKVVLESAHPVVRKRAALMLDCVGDKSGVEVMIADMGAEDSNDIIMAIEALRVIKDSRAIPALIEAVDDPEPYIRVIAIDSLVELRAREAFDVVAKHLEDNELQNRTKVPSSPAQSACKAIIEWERAETTGLLIKALDNEQTKQLASKALGKITRLEFGSEIEQWKNWWQIENIDGKNIVIRVYENWQGEPEAFKTVTVKIADRKPVLKSLKINKSVVIAILADDQKDKVVRKAIGNRIYASLYKDMGFQLPRYRLDREPQWWWTFKDALGNPFDEGVVDIFLSRRVSQGKDIRILAKSVELSGSNRLPIPRCIGTLGQFSAVVSRPDYGIVPVEHLSGSRDATIDLPLVDMTTKAGERAIWGFIIDSQGNPISGASITCSVVRGLGDAHMRSIKGWDYAVLSDEQGYFSYYLPAERKALIPPNAQYQVRVDAPDSHGLLPYEVKVPNGEETTIIMGYEGYFRTFVFEDANGPITDSDKLKRTYIQITQKNKSPQSLRYRHWKNGLSFPLGKYEAVTSDGQGHRIEFEPIEVTQESPEELVFILPPSTDSDIDFVYYGQVVDGITSEPMEGAFVFCKQTGEMGNFSQVSPEQWDALHELGDNPSVDEPALDPFKNICGIKKITRSDQRGNFEIGIREKFYSFIIIEQDYLGIERQTYGLKVDGDSDVDIGAIKLFPAATVKVESTIETVPQWLIDTQGNPVWVKELLTINGWNRIDFTVHYKYLRPKFAQSFHVPAGIDLRVHFSAAGKWCPVTETINLRQGQTLDLGELNFKPMIEVCVKVVDSAGEPVEGIPVSKATQYTGGGPGVITDEDGRVCFKVAPYSIGKFRVTFMEYNEETKEEIDLHETLPYEIGGEESEGFEFTLPLSDEIIYQFLKS
ncbi:HEAT repeat domain-containing protein [Planctomycetota bacterium]